MGRLRSFFVGPSAPPAPPPRTGPFASRAAAQERATALDREFWAHLDSYRGFMDVVEEDGGWYVEERRGRRKPGSWGAGGSDGSGGWGIT